MKDNSTKENLSALLNESVESAKERGKTSFDQLLIGKDLGYVLFGSGGLGKRTLAGLRKLGIEPYCFVDNNQNIWNQQVDGLTVLSPEEAIQKFPNSIFILTIWSDVIGHPFDEIEKQLNSYGKCSLVTFAFLYWKYPDVFLPYFGIDLPYKTLEQAESIMVAYSLWADDASRKEYLAQIRWRLSFDFKGLPNPVSYKHYFPDDIFIKSTDEVFIDCGAFDGDTLRNFLSTYNNRFHRYFAFEPDPDNFKRLKDFVINSPGLKEKIVVDQIAISDSKKRITFAANGSLQSMINEDGNILVDCISIDEISFNCIPTYIKMDTEGAEPDIIIGARNLIKNQSPLLAISIYHKYDHLWKLPLLVKTLSSNYRFYLRPHCKACWDLVCYAVPLSRVIKT